MQPQNRIITIGFFLPRDECKKWVKKYYKIVEHNDVEYVECYKSVRVDYTSFYNLASFTYDKFGFENEYNTDCNFDDRYEASFGFGCWTVELAIDFASSYEQIIIYKLLKCLVPLDLIYMLETRKIRSRKLIVLGECDRYGNLLENPLKNQTLDQTTQE